MLKTIRRPEYTGENRCWPCTVVNVVLVGLATITVALFSPLVAFGLALGGSGAILLRGYAVPYTPRFAPKLVERLPSSWNPFHAERVGPRESDSLATDDVDPEALLGALIEADVVAANGERLTLEKRFRERWREEMRTLRERSDEELAAAARDASAAASAAETVEGRERTHFVLSDGTGDPMTKSWLTRPVAVAETAAVRALSETTLSRQEAALAAGLLRMFLEECPVCDAPVHETSEAMCCGGGRAGSRPPRDVLACEECGRLYTFPE
ncbi:hypothetical protein [Halalkalicoccus ordinarius]|uniref:hypothetical protein n=1 Tax=Halalkalicoccus ordinarius TaxID=3116651 RepID=UPI00300F7A5D